LSSIVSVLPGLINPAGEVSLLFLLSIFIILIGNGLTWILVLSWNALRNQDFIQSLRDE
jgi:hypothetical protein